MPRLDIIRGKIYPSSTSTSRGGLHGLREGKSEAKVGKKKTNLHPQFYSFSAIIIFFFFTAMTLVSLATTTSLIT
jgi:hypothetical protein